MSGGEVLAGGEGRISRSVLCASIRRRGVWPVVKEILASAERIGGSCLHKVRSIVYHDIDSHEDSLGDDTSISHQPDNVHHKDDSICRLDVFLHLILQPRMSR